MKVRRGTLIRGIGLCTALYVGFLTYSATSSRRPARIKQDQEPPYHKLCLHTDYKSLIPELLEHKAPHYVLFTSGTFQGTLEGDPWCPDCQVTLPIVRQSVAMVGGSLLEVEVGTRNDWADRQHPLRIDKEAPVQYVPTLYHWTPSGPGARISNQLNSDEEVEALRITVAQFLNSTAGSQHSVVSFAQLVIESKGKKCGGC